MQVTEKEKYQLWRGYLQESPKYKTLCEWHRENQKNPELPWPEELPRSLGLSFDFFGDIYAVSFEKWWATKKDRDPGIGVIEYDRQQANHEIDSTIKNFVRSHGREPTLHEFKEDFVKRLFDHLPGCSPFRVCFHPSMSTKDLSSQFSELIRAKRELPETQSWEKEYRRGWLPMTGRFRHDQIRRYLEVYRLDKKGKKISDIAGALDPYGERDEADFYQDLRHAKKILQNVEDGYFPGNYYKKTKLGNREVA